MDPSNAQRRLKGMEKTMREISMRIIEISEISPPHTFFALATTGKMTHILRFCFFPPRFFAKHYPFQKFLHPFFCSPLPSPLVTPPDPPCAFEYFCLCVLGYRRSLKYEHCDDIDGAPMANTSSITPTFIYRFYISFRFID